MYVSNNVYMYKCTLVQCKKQEETKLGLRNLMRLSHDAIFGWKYQKFSSCEFPLPKLKHTALLPGVGRLLRFVILHCCQVRGQLLPFVILHYCQVRGRLLRFVILHCCQVWGQLLRFVLNQFQEGKQFQFRF